MTFPPLSFRRVLLLGLPVLTASALLAAEPPERIRLYSPPEASAPGGIQGRIIVPDRAIEQILAIPSDEPRLVYRGELSGPDKQSFQFRGLPMRKYDLVVIYPDCFHEGLKLQRSGDSLTAEDREQIATSIQASEPFFTKKMIHRLEGEHGQGNLCRALCTFLRDRSSELMATGKRADYRRTFKLVMLKDVGPGWQIVRARDLYPVWTTPAYARPEHHVDRSLSQIRVTNTIKDLGDLSLGR